MRWSRYDAPPKWASWSLWFAWRPVDIGDKRVWLEWVERKGTEHCGGDQCVISWEYRDSTGTEL